MDTMFVYIGVDGKLKATQNTAEAEEADFCITVNLEKDSSVNIEVADEDGLFTGLNFG